MQNARLDKSQFGIKIIGKNINYLRYADDTTLMAETEEELKSLLMKVKEESEKAGLKLNIQKTTIRAACPITSWQIEGEKVETMTDFILLSSKFNGDGDCSPEIKRCLLLGRMSSVQLSHSVMSDFLRHMNHSTPGLPVHHQHPEFAQNHVHRVSDAIQPSHPLLSPSSPAPNPFQHQSLFQ